MLYVLYYFHKLFLYSVFLGVEKEFICPEVLEIIDYVMSVPEFFEVLFLDSLDCPNKLAKLSL
jgi:hypothetical protein